VSRGAHVIKVQAPQSIRLSHPVSHLKEGDVLGCSLWGVQDGQQTSMPEVPPLQTGGVSLCRCRGPASLPSRC